MIGPAAEITEKLAALEEMGVAYVLLSGQGSRPNLRRFAEKVMPKFCASSPRCAWGGVRSGRRVMSNNNAVAHDPSVGVSAPPQLRWGEKHYLLRGRAGLLDDGQPEGLIVLDRLARGRR